MQENEGGSKIYSISAMQEGCFAWSVTNKTCLNASHDYANVFSPLHAPQVRDSDVKQGWEGSGRELLDRSDETIAFPGIMPSLAQSRTAL